ncbi:MAG: hypothetical protein WA996_19220 [Candidatus Promineifilaceae bacterium]
MLAVDKQVDLAILTEEAAGLPVIETGYGSHLHAGQWILALGHSWGALGTTTAGMVISVGKPVEGLGYPGPLIQVGLTCVLDIPVDPC